MKDSTEDMLFFRAFGASPRNKVLMFLIENNIFDYSKYDIAENCGISRATLDTFFRDILKLGILQKTRDVGRATLYKVNMRSPIVAELARLNELVADKYAETLLEKQTVYA
ncbi:hypothetical protein KKH30_04270 [Candidatus Micrarchaeota archaeon]|nr:hypothetical protein [Candidatus Micrarchaeota archaeon]